MPSWPLSISASLYLKDPCLKLVFLALALSSVAICQTAAAADPWKPLAFREGTWDAKAQGGAGATAAGTYTFRRELSGHVMARHSTTSAGCKGPDSFDCEHGDLLYIYDEEPGKPLTAIYFDNEGHVIHYAVSTPTPTSVIFLSEPSRPGP